MNVKDGQLPVPDAKLYYRIQGSGPFLLVLQGGDGGADAADGMVAHLTDHYTVLTYDRRGLSRSKIDPGAPPPTVTTHAEDAHLLLSAVTSEPTFVVGNSIGAVLGLELISRHPEQVRRLVAHEPPLPELLPDAERLAAVSAQEEMERAFAQEGAAGVMRKTPVQMDLKDRESDVVLPAASPDRAANYTYFMRYDAPAVRRYRLHQPALHAAAGHIVPAYGAASGDTWLRHCVEALAALLDRAVAEFPGGHNGFLLHPRGFASRLKEVLGAE
jgi:pimeloyl-ACP methyl ester carboxylesterase